MKTCVYFALACRLLRICIYLYYTSFIIRNSLESGTSKWTITQSERNVVEYIYTHTQNGRKKRKHFFFLTASSSSLWIKKFFPLILQFMSQIETAARKKGLFWITIFLSFLLILFLDFGIERINEFKEKIHGH